MTLLCEYRGKESAHLSLFRVAIKRRYAKLARYLRERTPIINKKKYKFLCSTNLTFEFLEIFFPCKFATIKFSMLCQK